MRHTAPETTADSLIDAGITLFGERGFKATTTRMIAERAGANIGSIAYYFGNKRGLYLRIAQQISEQLQQKLGIDEDNTQRNPAQADARNKLQQLARAMVRLYARDPQARRWLLLVMRELANPGDAFDVLYANAFEKIHRYVSGSIAALTGIDAQSDQAILQTHFFIGQIAFLLVARHPLLRRLGQQDDFSEAQIALMESIVVKQIEQLSSLTLAEGGHL